MSNVARFILLCGILVTAVTGRCQEPADTVTVVETDTLLVEMSHFVGPDNIATFSDVEIMEESIDSVSIDSPTLDHLMHYDSDIYFLPYSLTLSRPNVRQMRRNTIVLGCAFVGTLFVLECLPEDATAWNRKEIQDHAPCNRWWHNVIEMGPEWDHDKFYFNYLLHPYAGAAYFMAARSCGYNFYQSMLYSALISTVFWEFGIEAFMERPSYQDLFVTPVVGSIIGEAFYKLKRRIVHNGYRLGGSAVLGNVVAVLIDPVNEVIGFFAGNDSRRRAQLQQNVHSAWTFRDHGAQLNIVYNF